MGPRAPQLDREEEHELELELGRLRRADCVLTESLRSLRGQTQSRVESSFHISMSTDVDLPTVLVVALLLLQPVTSGAIAHLARGTRICSGKLFFGNRLF